MRILLVEDDALVADAVVRGLNLAGFAMEHCASAEHAAALLRAENFDLAVIDIGLPGKDGLSLVSTLRRAGKGMPVLILTAHYGLADKIRAFDVGADDFLMKPFEQAELAARCRALIRRTGLVPSGTLQLGRIAIDLIGHHLTIDARPIELTRREWLIFERLAHSIGRVVTKERLMQALSASEQELTANAVETHVSRLRAKIGDAAVIRTIRGLGYRLDEGAERGP